RGAMACVRFNNEKEGPNRNPFPAGPGNRLPYGALGRAGRGPARRSRLQYLSPHERPAHSGRSPDARALVAQFLLERGDRAAGAPVDILAAADPGAAAVAAGAAHARENRGVSLAFHVP